MTLPVLWARVETFFTVTVPLPCKVLGDTSKPWVAETVMLPVVKCDALTSNVAVAPVPSSVRLSADAASSAKAGA